MHVEAPSDSIAQHMEKCADIEATHIFHTMLIVDILSFIRIRWPLWDSIMEMCHAHWNCAPLYLIPPWCGVQPKAVIGLKICSWLLFDWLITIRALSLSFSPCLFSIAHQERCGARHRYRVMLVNLLRWKHLTFDDTAICVETKWNEIWK